MRISSTGCSTAAWTRSRRRSSRASCRSTACCRSSVPIPSRSSPTSRGAGTRSSCRTCRSGAARRSGSTTSAAEIGFARRDGISRLARLYQRDPLRVLFPAPAAGDPPVAVIVTTSGGLVAGDRLDIRVELAPGATAHVTASAAEKVYRSTGRTTTIRQTLSIGPGAALEFLPPETILFDGARLQRETVIDLAPGSAFLGGDIVVFGRRARGERFANGF